MGKVDYFIPIPKSIRHTITRYEHSQLSKWILEYYSTEGGDSVARQKIESFIEGKTKSVRDVGIQAD